MHSAMFVADIGEDQHRINEPWKAFCAHLEVKIKPNQGVERLAENVWLLDLTVSMAPLGYLIAGAENLGISYRTLPFDAAPQWLPDGQNPEATQGRSGGLR